MLLQKKNNNKKNPRKSKKKKSENPKKIVIIPKLPPTTQGQPLIDCVNFRPQRRVALSQIHFFKILCFAVPFTP